MRFIPQLLQGLEISENLFGNFLVIHEVVDDDNRHLCAILDALAQFCRDEDDITVQQCSRKRMYQLGYADRYEPFLNDSYILSTRCGRFLLGLHKRSFRHSVTPYE